MATEAGDAPREDEPEYVTGTLMAGRRGIVMGIANDHSIAWGIARALRAQGAELAFTYQGDSFGRRVQPLAEQLGVGLTLPCDVSEPKSIEDTFTEIGKNWGEIDFIVHSLAYSDKSELKGRYMDTSRDNFLRTMDISCYSLTAVARQAAPLMRSGGGMITLTFMGSEKVMPNYNVMGVAKAALEASVRYLAMDLGPIGVRINAISAGPMRTLAGSAIGSARSVYNYTKRNAPLGRNATLEEIGGTAVYLLSPLSGATSGEVIHVDGGYHILGLGDLYGPDGSSHTNGA